MKDIHDIFTKFKKDFPQIFAKYEDLGKEVHENAGPLSDKSRWLIKIGISGACGHERALETHILKAKEAGVKDEEIQHALLLLIPTAGFPAFMEAYSILKKIG
jgi:4-carboxymuconolactone decarboxylase